MTDNSFGFMKPLATFVNFENDRDRIMIESKRYDCCENFLCSVSCDVSLLYVLLMFHHEGVKFFLFTFF